nr:S24 family peptidase [Thiohalocapsa marina]
MCARSWGIWGRLEPQVEQRDHWRLAQLRIAAGRPIEVPSQLRTSRPCYVLKVEGESMREAGILDGDYVVIEQRDTANDGEVVVALIRGEEATLKRIVQRPDRVILYPENSALSAQEYRPEEVQIQGVLVGQMRVYC